MSTGMALSTVASLGTLFLEVPAMADVFLVCLVLSLLIFDLFGVWPRVKKHTFTDAKPSNSRLWHRECSPGHSVVLDLK